MSRPFSSSSFLLACAAPMALLCACGEGPAIEQSERGLPDEAPAREVDRVTLPGDAAEGEGASLLAVAREDERFSTFVSAVEAAGLTSTIEAGDYTVFAPTDEAFEALPEGTIDALLQPRNRQQLRDLLGYHLSEGTKTASTIRGRNALRTVSGRQLDVTEISGRFRVGGPEGAVITQTDLSAGNGVIHVIDAVLLPPAAN